VERLNLPEFSFTFKEENGKKYIFDELRRRFLILTPEEWVRQNFIQYLIACKSYPASLIAQEMPFSMNEVDSRSDIVIYNRQGKIVVLVECKATHVPLSQQVFDQAAGYNLKLNAEILILTNGKSHHCCKPDYKGKKWIFLNDIPDFKELNSIGID
jgi:hypothetical protein